MSVRVALALRRRRLVLLVAAIGCAALVALPLVGLIRIDNATDRSHHYVELKSDLEDLTNGILALTTGALAQYGATHDPEAHDRAVTALAAAETHRAEVEERRPLMRELRIEEHVDPHLAIADEFFVAAKQFLEEVDAGATVDTADSTDRVVAAAGELLENQGPLTIALAPAGQSLDADRRSSVRNAQYLLGAAALIALLALGTLIVLDSRRVERAFADESGRREQAERLAAHRADVVSMASHELRNPLTVLTMSTDLLKRTAQERGDAQFEVLAEDARLAARRCDMLVSELLDLGRLDADRLQLRIGTTPLLPAVRTAIEVSESQHGERDVTIAGDASIQVHADPERLRIILRNLVDNAFKYSPSQSEVVIRITQGMDRVRIDVVDGGLGVPESDHERIFQRFERAHSTAHIPGVGIGLFLSRELARRMNGDLKCVAADRGSDFCLELPIAS